MNPTMKITAVTAWDLVIPYPSPYRPAWQPGVVRTSRDFTLVKVETREGLAGYAGTDGHRARTIQGSVTPYLIGQDVCATERHAGVFRRAGGQWFVDTALWDIVGQAAGLPLYRLWGSSRNAVPAYASTAELGTPEDRAALAQRYQSEGFRAMKLRFHRKDLRDDLEALDSVMAAAPGLALMVDANQATELPTPEPAWPWDYGRALHTARELEARGVLWLEEPLPRHDLDSLVRLRENTAIDIAGGEANRGLHEFRLLIERGAYDIVQPDCCLSEGVSQLRKIAALAEAHHRGFVPHHGLSGIGLAATVHLACTVPGPTWIEMMYEPPTRTIQDYQRLGGILETAIRIDADGNVRPPDSPGLGIRVDESRIGSYAVYVAR